MGHAIMTLTTSDWREHTGIAPRSFALRTAPPFCFRIGVAQGVVAATGPQFRSSMGSLCMMALTVGWWKRARQGRMPRYACQGAAPQAVPDGGEHRGRW
jgi:hypothetical protein